MNIYNRTKEHQGLLISKGFVLVSYPSITYPWSNRIFTTIKSVVLFPVRCTSKGED